MANLHKMSIKALNRNLNKKDLIYDSTRRYFIDKHYAYAWMGSDIHHSIGIISLSSEH